MLKDIHETPPIAPNLLVEERKTNNKNIKKKRGNLCRLMAKTMLTKKKKIAFKEKVRIPKAKVLQSNNYSMMTLKTRQ